MINNAADKEFWDLVDGIGVQYDSNERMRSGGIKTALRVAEQIAVNEREGLTTPLLKYLKDIAARNGPTIDEIDRTCGACLLLGHWRIQEAVPTISRFLKVHYAKPPRAALDSLEMITSTGSQGA